MAYAHSEVLAERHRRLRQALLDRQLDALVVTHLPNVFYLTNFSGSSAIVVLTTDALFFITDFRYITAVETSWATPSGCPGASLVSVATSYDETLIGLLRSLAKPRVGFEAAHVPVAQYGRWTAGLGQTPGTQAGAPGGHQASGVALVATERVVEAQRTHKDAHEVATLRRAGEMLTGAFGRILAEVRPGRAEHEVAARLERTSFETIVASGPNAALPHARPGTRRLQPGDLAVLDFGGVYDGYCVDLTRSVSIGDPSAEARRIWAAVTEAHAAGIAASRPGATAREIDRATRGTLERLGLGEAFGHGTGHGLGIEVHEEPWLRKTTSEAASGAARAGESDVVIEAGMVFTIEPGVYLPGWGGVRLEDDLVVGATGAELLTQAPRELAVV